MTQNIHWASNVQNVATNTCETGYSFHKENAVIKQPLISVSVACIDTTFKDSLYDNLQMTRMTVAKHTAYKLMQKWLKIPQKFTQECVWATVQATVAANMYNTDKHKNTNQCNLAAISHNARCSSCTVQVLLFLSLSHWLQAITINSLNQLNCLTKTQQHYHNKNFVHLHHCIWRRTVLQCNFIGFYHLQ